MSTVINLNKQSVLIEKIWVEVQCPSCEKSFNVSLKSPSFSKNCRCRNATFYFNVSSAKGSRIIVNVSCQVGFSQPVDIVPLGYEIEDE